MTHKRTLRGGKFPYCSSETVENGAAHGQKLPAPPHNAKAYIRHKNISVGKAASARADYTGGAQLHILFFSAEKGVPYGKSVLHRKGAPAFDYGNGRACRFLFGGRPGKRCRKNRKHQYLQKVCGKISFSPAHYSRPSFYKGFCDNYSRNFRQCQSPGKIPQVRNNSLYKTVKKPKMLRLPLKIFYGRRQIYPYSRFFYAAAL